MKPEIPPSSVSRANGTTQDGDIRLRWSWTEQAVWTNRMLTALEQGVKGGFWFSLMDKVYAPRNLEAAYQQVARNQGAAGVDHVTVQHFGERLSDELPKLSLIEAFLTANIMEGLNQWTPEAGAPQGAVLSPLLSNVYLNPLDHEMAQQGFEMVRYADDFVILCRTPEDAQRAWEVVQPWTADNGLQLHPTKTKIVDVRTAGFEFLGYRFVKHRRFPRRKSLTKFKEALREKTKRTSGHCLRYIITDVNFTLRGWFEYFKHAHRTSFAPLDSWVRMRLRSILRKRRGRRGCGRGNDHQRWPNAYFAERGLFSLVTAHATVVQSSKR